MYAIIETGGKQLKVEAGQSIFVEKLNVEPGDEVVFDKVILVSDASTKIGIFKYKAKKGSTRRRQGHRQPYTKLSVESIEA